MNYKRAMQYVTVLHVLWNLLEDFRVEISYSSFALFQNIFSRICKRRYWKHSHETRIICTSETFGLWVANDPREVFAWRYSTDAWEISRIFCSLAEIRIMYLSNARQTHYRTAYRKLNVAIEWLVFLFLNREVPATNFGPDTGCPDLGVFVVFLRSSRQIPGSVSQTGPRPQVSISFPLYLFTDRSVIRRVRPKSERLDFREINCQQVNKQTSRRMTGMQKYTFLIEFVNSLKLGFSIKILSFLHSGKDTTLC